ncbi:hypothetical protein MMC26_001366 [Xylographa opegraphella]|nr:hypothetical protein [Xylographa opegraphella]
MWYCSRACQKEDWKVHKLLCSTFAAFETPQEYSHKRAILFQQDAEHPQFVWIETGRTDEGYDMELKKLLHLPGEQSETTASDLVKLNRINLSRQRPLRHNITLMCRDDFFKDGSIPNKSIIGSTKGMMKYDWRGPILAVAQEVNSMPEPPYDDLTLHDFRDIVDYFLTYDGTRTAPKRWGHA